MKISSLIAQSVKNLPARQETWVGFLGPGERNGNPFQILAWRIPPTEELDRLESMGSQESDTT